MCIAFAFCLLPLGGMETEKRMRSDVVRHKHLHSFRSTPPKTSPEALSQALSSPFLSFKVPHIVLQSLSRCSGQRCCPATTAWRRNNTRQSLPRSRQTTSSSEIHREKTRDSSRPSTLPLPKITYSRRFRFVCSRLTRAEGSARNDDASERRRETCGALLVEWSSDDFGAVIRWDV